MLYIIAALLLLLALVFAWGWFNKVQVTNLLQANRRQVAAEIKAVELKAETFWGALKKKVMFWRKQ